MAPPKPCCALPNNGQRYSHCWPSGAGTGKGKSNTAAAAEQALVPTRGELGFYAYSVGRGVSFGVLVGFRPLGGIARRSAAASNLVGRSQSKQ